MKELTTILLVVSNKACPCYLMFMISFFVDQHGSIIWTSGSCPAVVWVLLASVITR